MVKKIVFVLLFVSGLLYAENYIDMYRYGGIEKVENIFDKKLQSKEYWDKYLKDYNTTYGYFEKKKYIIVADKTNKKLQLFFTAGNGDMKKIFAKDIITGKSGEKKEEGDLVTPVGVYRITKKFVPKDTYYGPVAFALSYPNLYDRLNGRDGHGIWIHGYPLDHEKRPPVTKGCMVLKNPQLLDLDKSIEPNECFVVIHEHDLKPVSKDKIATILSFLYKWRDAWKKNKIDRYLSFYAKDFKRYNGEKLPAFSVEKRKIFSKKDKKEIYFKYINILPYPNLQNKSIYKIYFYEIYKTKHYKFNGGKKLYIRFVDNKPKIFMEK